METTITLAGFQPAGDAKLFSYGILQDEAARTESGSPDIEMTDYARAGIVFVRTFAPYSATVVVLSPATAK